MLNTSNNFIRDYCVEKFKSNHKLCSDGMELVVPSLFVENDYKRHMSINTETGLWRCFKSGETGNFIKLYSILENCSYSRAYEKFALRELLMETPVEDPEKEIQGFENTDLFELAKDNDFIKSRFLDSFDFYLAKEGFYKDRLIIPFFDGDKNLFYFQARSLKGQEPKYLNCKRLKSSTVLYPYDYASQKPLYITEGVFDCLSLQLVGRNATTTLSCYTSKEQMQQLRHYQGPLVCAFDNDNPGREGAEKFMRLARKYKRTDLYSVSPNTPYKDWNEILVKKGPDELVRVAESYTPLTPLDLAVRALSE